MPSDHFWGNLIKSLRVERSLTQRQLAIEAKVNRSTLRRIEAGDTSADVVLLERILRTFGYELEAMEASAWAARTLSLTSMNTTSDRRAKVAKQRLRVLPVGLLTVR